MAKEEGKKIACAFIMDGHDEILRAMDIISVPLTLRLCDLQPRL
jgi:hypothetical protein